MIASSHHDLGDKKLGPTLADVFERASGNVDGFKYSLALKNAHQTWDSATPDKWLAGPTCLVHGTTMSSAFRATAFGINGTPHEIDPDRQIPLSCQVRLPYLHRLSGRGGSAPCTTTDTDIEGHEIARVGRPLGVNLEDRHGQRARTPCR